MIFRKQREAKKSRSQRQNCLWLLPFAIHTLFFFLLIFSNNTFSQYYNSGTDNGFIKWRQIKTDKFQIIYPDFYEKKAQEFASVLQTVHNVVGKSLNAPPPNIPFLLHTNTAYSNGLSVWAPKRIELWMTTSPTNYAYPWSWQLAIHEWRHSVQVYALKKGVSKALINTFGEHIYGLLLGIYIPNWFLEGDAVVAETALTPTGRGKTPDFNMYFKAQVMDKGRYCLDKALHGSMKDFVPDHYILGYHLVSFTREKYDKDIWGDMLENVGRNFWKIQIFGDSEKRKIKINEQELYNEMLDTLSRKWKEEDKLYYENKKDIPSKRLSSETNFYCNYLSPKKINDSTILALKTSYYETPKLVEITLNKEEEIFSPGRILHSYYDSREGYLIWSEYKPHFRWENQNYADLVEYDANKKQYNLITQSKRLYTPAYNPKNPNVIAAIEDDALNCQHLVIIDKTTGNIIKKFQDNGECVSLSYPAWDDKNNNIYIIKSNEQGKSIGRFNMFNDSYTEILAPSFNNISKPTYYNDRLYFIGDYNNTYQVYSIDLKQNSYYLYKHTKSRYGVMDFTFSGNNIIISDYTADGSIINLQPLTVVDSIAKNTSTPMFPLADTITKQENFILTKEYIKDTVWESKKYRKLSHLFNFHSWAPLYINIDSKDIGIGVSAFSQNLLGTSTLEGGYKYLIEEKRDEYFVDYTYQGWYPIIKCSFKYGKRNIIFDTVRNYDYYSSWDEYNAGINIEFPYSWTLNNWNYYCKYSFLYSLRSITPGYNFVDALTLFNTSGFGLSWGVIQSMASNDIVPRWGQTLNLNFQRSITSDNAHIIAINATTYIPGFARNNSFQIDLNFQKNSPTVYYFPNEVAFTRGVVGKFPTYFYGGKINYNLPLSYPDLAIGWFVYIKRLTARGFFDFGVFDNEYINSFGTDIQMDFHFLRLEQAFNIGIRLGYVPQEKNFFANLLFNINI
ncbi:MAG: hypothetical protein WC679_12570 [Bacteroidales bacterium]|jgi:hypothetical protein